MELVLATRNRKKAEELARMLKGAEVSVLTLNDFPDCPEVEEDRDTFEGNAVKKALAVAGHTNRTAVADDSGLEVYALGNAPGIRSARYAGENADDEANIQKLLLDMDNLPDDKRGGRFVCCIALAFSDGRVVTFQGFVEGTIGREKSGIMGFGYDPVFYPLNSELTFADMTPEEKDTISHRQEALSKLKSYIEMLNYQ